MMRAILFGAAIAMASPAFAQTTERLTVDAAVAMAMANNRSVMNAALETEKAENDVQSARSQRLPQFSLDTTMSELLSPVHVRFAQGAFGSYPGIGPIPGTDTAITTSAKPTLVLSAQISQPLTQLHELNLNVRLSESASQLARETARATRLTIGYQVKRLYYAILQNENALAATEHSAAVLRELGRVVGERVIQKAALRADALDVDTRAARVEQQRVTIAHAIASQKEQLNQLLGRDVRTAFELDGMPDGDVTAADLDAAHSRALEARPELRQTRIRLQQAMIAERLARADRVPDVSLTISYYSPMNIDGAPRNIASAGVQLQWEPFDWGRRSRAVASRQIDVQRAENALRDEQDRAVIEVSAQFRKLSEARIALRVAALAQQQTREISRVRADQYRLQAALLSDVLQAASSQADADSQYQQALAALWAARAEFERALGED
jgi:outer membrane protein TolC